MHFLKKYYIISNSGTGLMTTAIRETLSNWTKLKTIHTASIKRYGKQVEFSYSDRGRDFTHRKKTLAKLAQEYQPQLDHRLSLSFRDPSLVDAIQHVFRGLRRSEMASIFIQDQNPGWSVPRKLFESFETYARRTFDLAVALCQSPNYPNREQMKTKYNRNAGTHEILA
jgi:hypothetical protein